jgi:uncharacterized protein (DUF2267 family)
MNYIELLFELGDLVEKERLESVRSHLPDDRKSFWVPS